MTAENFVTNTRRLIRGNGWAVGRQISVGKWSRIHLASPVHRRDDETYVAKIARKDCQQPKLALLMLEREFAISQSVHHSNLISVLDASFDETPEFLIQPRLKGIRLLDLIHSKVQHSLPYCLWICRQIADALSALHASSIVHCDVSPANVMVSTEGHATLIDLGFAQPESIAPQDKLPDFFNSNSSKINSTLIGTTRYISPEVLSDSSHREAASDIYSLGVLMFELLNRTHRGLFDDPSKITRLDIRQALSGTSRATCELVESMTERSPNNRPNAAEVAKSCLRLEVENFAARFEAA